MNPISPVIPGFEHSEVTYAKDQPEYKPLPALPTGDGVILTRWRMNRRERLRALLSGDVYLWVWTFGGPLQPVSLTTNVNTPNDERRIARGWRWLKHRLGIDGWKERRTV